jgi:HlyD family secretion protein/epimerase transport system membrane fusion protein
MGLLDNNSPAAFSAIPTDTRFDARLAIFIIVLTLGGFLAWGVFAELESGAIAAGEVVPSGRVRTVQHLDGGMIKAIKVRDGDQVKKGAELLLLDDAEVQAAIDMADRDLLGFRSRLLEVAQEIEGWSARRKSLNRLVANAEEESKINRELFEKKFVSRPRLLQLESQKAQAEVSVGENEAELARARQKMSELQATEAAVREKRALALLRLERTRVLAPQDGVVNNLKYATLGGVIPPGGAILDLVPDGEELMIEAKIAPDDIDVVYPGLVTRVKLTAYKARSHITLHGKVITVSGTTSRDESLPGRSYYRARIEIGAEELKKVDRGMLTPGMLAEVSIVSGRRSVLRYLLDPVFDSFGRAFRES